VVAFCKERISNSMSLQRR